jgi:hypothetical protein
MNLHSLPPRHILEFEPPTLTAIHSHMNGIGPSRYGAEVRSVASWRPFQNITQTDRTVFADNMCEQVAAHAVGINNLSLNN